MVVLNSWKPSGRDILRKNVQDAQQWLGENAAVCSMYNSQNAEGVPRCSHCFNPIYGSSSTSGGICQWCYGTGYEGGIRKMWLCPVLPSQTDYSQTYDNRGQLAGELMGFQLPDYVETWQDDFILRLNGWQVKNTNGIFTMTPAITTVYELDTPQPQFVKDGLGFMGTEQRIGTMVLGSLVNTPHPICKLFLNGLPMNLIDYSMPVPIPIQTQNGAILVPYIKNGETSNEPNSTTSQPSQQSNGNNAQPIRNNTTAGTPEN